MSDYHRFFVPGGSYFFTIVTYDRRPILTEDLGRSHLHNAFIKIKRKMPFHQLACCLLPEHLHAIWPLHQAKQTMPCAGNKSKKNSQERGWLEEVASARLRRHKESAENEVFGSQDSGNTHCKTKRIWKRTLTTSTGIHANIAR